MQLNKIPATVVTGFLGSGKTTLLANLLKQANGKRIAVIVNEFGEMDIDADLLRSCPLDCEDEVPVQEAANSNGIYELANGCICCTVEEEFLPVMKELIKRRDSIDHILIETSGLALPKPLVQAFSWPEVKQHFTVDAVITVIDGPAVADGRFAHDPQRVQEQRLQDENLDHDPSLHELLEDQLSAADLVVISKNDLLDANAREHVAAIVRDQIAPSVKTVYIENGTVDAGLLLGLEAASEERIDHVHTHHDEHHEHGEEHHHAHEDFDSFVIKLGVVDSQKLVEQLQALVAEYQIYRIKGFAALPNKPMRQVIQVVGKRVDQHFDRLWNQNETHQTSLVFIGKGINRDVIQQRLESAEIEH